MVLDLEATNQMDTTTAERLQQMMLRLRPQGIDLYLVRVFGNVRDVLTRSGFLDELGPEHVWHSIAAGVKAARSAPPIAVVLPDGASAPGDLTRNRRRWTSPSPTSPRTACTASTSPPSVCRDEPTTACAAALASYPSLPAPALALPTGAQDAGPASPTMSSAWSTIQPISGSRSADQLAPAG